MECFQVQELIEQPDVEVVAHRIDDSLTFVYFVGTCEISLHQFSALPNSWKWHGEAEELAHLVELRKAGRRPVLCTKTLTGLGAEMLSWKRFDALEQLPGNLVRCPMISRPRPMAVGVDQEGWTTVSNRKARSPDHPKFKSAAPQSISDLNGLVGHSLIKEKEKVEQLTSVPFCSSFLPSPVSSFSFLADWLGELSH